MAAPAAADFSVFLADPDRPEDIRVAWAHSLQEARDLAGELNRILNQLEGVPASVPFKHYYAQRYGGANSFDEILRQLLDKPEPVGDFPGA